MKTITYKNSWVKFCDCIDGMKELPDKSIDLCLTDPPWNINYTKSCGSSRGKTGDSSKRYFYSDTIENYEEWSLQWFNEAMRVCKNLILFPGRQNLKQWYCTTTPTDLFIWYRPNGGYGSYIAYFNNFEPVLFFLEHPKPYLTANAIYQASNIGFNRKNKHDDIFLHSSPKNLNVVSYIVRGMNPSSVLDPFMGSGTTLEACIQLGIPCYGFELMEEYAVDIEKRIERCKYYTPQAKLDQWFEVDDTDLQNEMNSKSEI